MEADDIIVDITIYKVPVDDARKIAMYAQSLSGEADFGMFSSSVDTSNG